MSKAQAVAAALLAGLLAGTFIGYKADRSALRKTRHRGFSAERVAGKLSRDLKLDPAQSAKLRELLVARRSKHDALRKEHEARFKALRAEIDADIEKLLTEEQRKAFAEKRARWEKRRAR